MKKGILILAAFGMTLQLCAQVPRWTSQAWAAAQAELKKAVPQKYAEIEKLQSVNMLAAMEKLRDDLWETILEIASGRQTKAEQMNFNEIAVWKDGVTE